MKYKNFFRNYFGFSCSKFMQFLIYFIFIVWLAYVDITGEVLYCSGGPVDNYMSDSETNNITNDQTNLSASDIAELDRLTQLKESTLEARGNMEHEKDLTAIQLRALSGTRQHARMLRLYREISAGIVDLIRTEHRINRQIRIILRNRNRNN